MTCAYCGADRETDLDPLFPPALDGKAEDAVRIPTCAGCAAVPADDAYAASALLEHYVRHLTEDDWDPARPDPPSLDDPRITGLIARTVRAMFHRETGRVLQGHVRVFREGRAPVELRLLPLPQSAASLPTHFAFYVLPQDEHWTWWQVRLGVGFFATTAPAEWDGFDLERALGAVLDADPAVRHLAADVIHCQARPHTPLNPVSVMAAVHRYLPPGLPDGGSGAEERSDVAPMGRAPDSLRRAPPDGADTSWLALLRAAGDIGRWPDALALEALRPGRHGSYANGLCDAIAAIDARDIRPASSDRLQFARWEDAVAAVADPHPQVRTAAAEVVFRQGDARATRALVAALSDTVLWPDRVRQTAATAAMYEAARERLMAALGAVGDVTAIPCLLESANVFVGTGATRRRLGDGLAATVARRVGGQAVDVIVATLARLERSDLVGQEAAQALGATGDPRAIPALRELRARGYKTGAAAERALERLGKKDP